MAAQIEASVSAEINELVRSLKKNPIFHMSLSSRELFHSNFLAWLAERHLPIFLNGLLNDNASPLKWGAALEAKSVEREKHNIDLLIEFEHSGQKCLLAVEVKVKDVLRRTQLSEYDKDIDKIVQERAIAAANVYKVALTLTNPSGEFKGWQVVTFEDFSKRLFAIVSSLSGDDQIFISYYRKFIQDLSCLTAIVTEISNIASHKLVPFTRNIFPDLDVQNSLEKDLRLHSTFGKLLASRLAHSLAEEAIYSRDLKQFEVFFRDSSEKYDGDRIFMAASGGFERGNGFTSISINKWIPTKTKAKKALLSVGVMLQGGSYRLIITHPSFDFERGPASDEARRERMYECVEMVQCKDWLQCEGKESLKGYAPKYIYTAHDIPMDRQSLGTKIIGDLTRALCYIETEVQRQSK